VSESERRQRTISSTPRLTPDEVAGRSFPTAFRGISETDVRAFLKRVAEDLGAVRAREQELSNTIEELEARLRTPRPLDEHELLDALGEETTRLLRSAREAASDIRNKAEERAARLVHDAHEESQRVRQEADEILGVKTHEAESVANGMLEEAEQRASDLMRVADERALEVRAAADRYAEELRARGEHESATEIDGARERGRSLLEDAATLRQRVIDDLGRRRELLSGQLEELRSGRDELLDAYRIVKRTFLEATEALAQVEARATAGRPVAGTDPADLAGAVAAETEAARAAGLEPEAEAEPESEAEAAGSPLDADGAEATAESPAAAVEPSTDAESDVDSVPNLADVDDLFARLRAGAQPETEAEADGTPSADDVASGPSATEGDAAPTAAAKAGDAKAGDAKAGDAKAGDAKAGDAKAGDARPPRAAGAKAAKKAASAPGTAADEPPAWLARRDEALAPLRVALVRHVKLAVGNEQNEVLDKVRRHKGRPVAASVLPEVGAQTDAWTAVVATATSEAYRLGWCTSQSGAPEGAADGDTSLPDDLARDLARAMVEPLRDRLVATIDGAHEPGETSNQVAERIGARYREWKNRSAESSADDALVAAYSRGRYDGAVDGAVLTWCVPPSGCCVDCADNALEPTRKGEAFPTGQAFPPAHPGCRCALAVDEVIALPNEGVDVASVNPS
jgi:DivIVA domain-containing protein